MYRSNCQRQRELGYSALRPHFPREKTTSNEQYSTFSRWHRPRTRFRRVLRRHRSAPDSRLASLGLHNGDMPAAHGGRAEAPEHARRLFPSRSMDSHSHRHPHAIPRRTSAGAALVGASAHRSDSYRLGCSTSWRASSTIRLLASTTFCPATPASSSLTCSSSLRACFWQLSAGLWPAPAIQHQQVTPNQAPQGKPSASLNLGDGRR